MLRYRTVPIHVSVLVNVRKKIFLFHDYVIRPEPDLNRAESNTNWAEPSLNQYLPVRTVLNCPEPVWFGCLCIVWHLRPFLKAEPYRFLAGTVCYISNRYAPNRMVLKTLTVSIKIVQKEINIFHSCWKFIQVLSPLYARSVYYYWEHMIADNSKNATKT